MKIAKYCIYALCAPDGAIRYIGKTTQGIKRPKEHGSARNLQINAELPVVRWIKKLRKEGKDYIIEAVEELPSGFGLADLEIFWISQFRALGFRLLNLTNGGDGVCGYRHTPAARAQMSIRQIGRKASLETRARMSAAHTGKTQTQEARDKVSKAQKGRKRSSEYLIKRSRLQGGRPFKDNLGNFYNTPAEAASALGLYKQDVRKVLKGKLKALRGFSFKYLGPL